MAKALDRSQQKNVTRAPRGSGRQRAYQALRTAILRLDLRPGEYLEEARLSELAGGSRTPVREALVRLNAEGLVTLLPNRSAQVSSITVKDVRDYFEALDLNQRAVARWAALRHGANDLKTIRQHMRAFEAAVSARNGERMLESNFRFHRSIAQACDNVFVADCYFRIQDYGVRLSRVALTFDVDTGHPLPARLEEIVDEHRVIVDRISARDADGAEGAAATHAQGGRDRVARSLVTIQSVNMGISNQL